MQKNNLKATVVKTGPNHCKPFIFDVMVYSPKSGYKVAITVKKGCNDDNSAIWQFIFDLYKKQSSGTDFDQLVHVSYKGLTPAENAAIIGMTDGMTDKQIAQLPALNSAAEKYHDDPSSVNEKAVTTAAQVVVNS